MNRKEIFENIYNSNIWNNNDITIPKSGPGSTIKNTETFRLFLDRFVYRHKIESIVDIGCGDLTWMPKTLSFNKISYTGIDIVQSIIDNHKIKYPNQKFMCLDCVEEDIPAGDIVIIRDVLFHLKIEEIKKILKKVMCRYLIVTSCRNTSNHDEFDRWKFHPINLTIDPFNMTNYIESIYEPEFNRDVFVYQFLSQ